MDQIRGDVGEDAESTAIGKDINQRHTKQQANPHQSQRVELSAAQNLSDIQIAVSEIRQGLVLDRDTRHEMRQQMWRMEQNITSTSRAVDKLLELERTFEKRMMFFEEHIKEQLTYAYNRATDQFEKQIRQVYGWMILGWLMLLFFYWMANR